MSEDLRRIAWLRSQWRIYCRLLWGTMGAVWLVGSAGVVLVPNERIAVRVALGIMLLVSTAYGCRLFLQAMRESRRLERLATEARLRLQEKQASVSQAGR